MSKSRAVSISLPSVPAALDALEKLETEIYNAPSFEALAHLANIAAAYHRAFKPVKEISDRAGWVWQAAIVRKAEELAKIPRATGGGNGSNQHERATGNKSEPVANEGNPTLAELGVTKRESAEAKKLAEMDEDERRRLADKLKEDGKYVTPSAILAEARREAKTEKKTALATAVFSETGPFDVVVIDPPWDMQKIDREVRPNQDAFDYPVMSENEIIAFWMKEIAGKLKDDCHIFMWTTQKFLPVALSLLDVFDLKYVLVMTWHKPGGFQPIGLPQYNCEFAVYARKGAPVFIDTKDFKCCFEAPRREHSRKPDEFYDTIRRVTGGSRIDVFSREKREGFSQYGNEIGKFDNA